MCRLYAALFLLFAVFSRVSPLLAQCPVVDAGEDLFLCSPPGPAQLNGSIDGPYLSFRWTPTAGLIGTNTLSPSVNVTQSTTYYLIARGVDPGNNLIINGDFEGGNSGFLSDYVYSPGNLVPEGVYEVLTNPQNSHPGFAPCSDHTSGSGNMMAVNGSGIPGTNVWCETVSVTPNTDYAFSAWVATLVAASPAILQFSINGIILGTPISAPPITCNWINFYQIWNSGPNTSATICIVNQNTTLGGNDFALDDIVFSPICEVMDSVRVNIVNIQAQASPLFTIIPCEGTEITLNGAGSSVGPDITYNWDTPNGNIVSGANTLNPVVNMAGTYTLTVTYNNGQVECTKTATVNVNPSPNPLTAWVTPPLPIGCGSSTTLLIGNSSQPAFSSYQWTAEPGGNIVSGANSSIATVDEPGIYNLLVTNTMTGCTAETSIVVLEATDPPVAVATTTITEFNCFSTSFPLDGTGSSTGNNISYAWTALNGGNIVNNPNFQSTVADAPGTYILTVTNTSNGCAASDTLVVVANLTPPEVTLQPPGMFTCSIDTIPLSGTVNNSTSLTTWTTADGGTFAGDSSLLNVLALTPGTYILGALDTTNFCYGADTVTVVIDTLAPLAVVLPADTITCQQPSLSLSGAGSSTGANFSYLWMASGGGNIVSGDTSLNPVVNAAGLYTLVVTNSLNACTADSSVVVYADDDALVAVANAPDTLTCADTLTMLNANGSSSVPGLLYSWTTTNGAIISGGDTPTPTIGAPGVYQLVLTNPANGCTATDDVTALQNIAVPALSLSPPDTLTCANPIQTLQGQNASPGSFVYIWTASNGGNILSGDSTLQPMVNAAGTYTLQATNLQNGCTAQIATEVAIEAGTPVAVAGVAGPITCEYPTRTLNTAGSSSGPNFSFSWAVSGGGNIVSGNGGPAPVVDAAGLYALTITNISNGCTATATVTVVEDLTFPPADAGPDGLITCAGPVFNLSANNGNIDPSLVFSWQTASGNFLGNPDSATVDVDEAGLYILTVINPQNGCSSTDTTVVTANQIVPDISLLPPGILTCSQPTVSLGLTGNAPQFTYQWQTANGQFVSGQMTAMPLVDAPGQYDLLVVDTINGCTATASTTVAQDIAVPLADAGPAPLLNCLQTQAALQGSVAPGAGIAVLWTTSGGNIVSGANTPSPIVNAPGDYFLLVTNTVNGCTNTAAVTVLQDIAKPLANAGPDATLSCTVSSLKLQGQGSANGAPSFIWTALAGGNIVSGADSPGPVIDAPGLYVLLVTDINNGCTASDTVSIAKDATAPVAVATSPGTLTCTVTQLSLQGNGSIGPEFSPLWTSSPGGNIVSGAASLSPVVNAPGVYTLTITNLNNGCTATAQSTVNQNITPPAVSIATPGILTCANPSISLSATPSGTNFTYFWQTNGGFIASGGTTPIPVVAAPGTYTLLVTSNTNGCTASATTQVSANTVNPVINAVAPDTLTCAVPQVALSGSVQQPVTGYLAGWTTANGQIVSGQNTLSPLVGAPGNYVLTVQDQQNGCTASATVSVAQNTIPPQANAGPAPEITCSNAQVFLDGSGSSGQGALLYQWSGGAVVSGGNTAAPTVSSAGTYTVTVTDSANGCTDTDLVLVSENTVPPVVQIATPLLRTCVRDTVVLDAGASSNGPEFTFNWTTANGNFAAGQTSLTPQVDASGVYNLTILNQQNGCTASGSVTVNNDFVPPQAEAGPGAELYCNNAEVALSGSSATTTPVTFLWTASGGGSILSGANSAQPVVNAAGTYQLTVTSLDNGCTATDAVAVTEVPPPAFTPNLMQPDCHRPTGSLAFGPVTGGRAPFRYSIDDGQTFQASPNFNQLQPGPYSLVVQDALGCTATVTTFVDEPFFPTVDLAVNTILDLGDSVQLAPVLNILYSQVNEWSWTPAEGLSCTDCPTPWARPLRPTTYTLSITDTNGCTATARVLIPVNRRRQLYAPNVFSPDGDGQNDRFLLFGRGVTEIQVLRIFDRWGNQMFLNEHFQPNEESMGWDGTYRGQAMNPGVFVWQAVVEFVDGAVEVFAGDVTLYR